MGGPARPLILASTSPRRRELLGRLGLAFEVADPGDAEEGGGPAGPLARARWAAAAKSAAVAADRPEAVVIGADTMVSAGGRGLGKPRDLEEARAMLRLLSGRTHTIYTAVHLRAGPQSHSGFARSMLTLRELAPSEIERYLAHGESMDKAGAYSIQGHGHELAVRRVGSLDTIIGLPVALVRGLLGRIERTR